jgi:hypothetical protein
VAPDILPETPAPLRTRHEEGYVPNPQTRAAAFGFNPNADSEALIAAAQTRANRLHSALESWTCIEPGGSVTLSEVVISLEPLAPELSMILDRLSDQSQVRAD